MDVLNYLKQVVKTQKEIIILQNLINAIDREYPKLGVEHKIKEPSNSNPNEEGIIDKFLTVIVIGLVYTGVIAIPFIIITGIFYSIFDYRLPILQDRPILRFFVTDLILSGILALPCAYLTIKSENKQSKEAWRKYYEQVSIQKSRINQEVAVKQNMERERQKLFDKWNETKSLLDRLYNMEIDNRLIIYPKYRNIVPITMFIEYLDSRRCSELEGPEGAYNIYENEARLNVIITKLDMVIERLDSIRENQYYLYETMSEINKKSDVIHRELLKISDNTQMTAFYSEITASNTSALAMIEGLRVMKYGV